MDILQSATDLANIEDCSTSHPNQTIVHTTVTTLPSTQPPTTPYNPCASNPCVHGVCQSSNTYDYSCTCEYGYVGRNCENVLKQCELLTPCRNGGTCTNLHGSYKCDCRLGYNGQNCDKREYTFCNNQIAIGCICSFRERKCSRCSNKCLPGCFMKNIIND